MNVHTYILNSDMDTSWHEIVLVVHLQIWSAEQERLIDVVHPNSLGVTLPGSDYLTLYLHPRSVASAVLDMVMDWRGHSHRRE